LLDVAENIYTELPSNRGTTATNSNIPTEYLVDPNDKFNIKYDEITLLSEVGRGSFGVVRNLKEVMKY
jgi:hypothetical protein